MEPTPRFEFRVFAQGFGMTEIRMRELSPVEQIRESSETYIVSSKTDKFNTKVRYDLLDIKEKIQVKEGCEQWSPLLKAEFPLKKDLLKDGILPALNIEVTEFEKDNYSFDDLLDEIINPDPEMVAVHIFKRRFGFNINDCMAEIADVYVNGAFIRTACIESTDTSAILEVKEMVGLDGYENVNYLEAIKRIIGMKPVPGKGWLYRS